ncbi:hypothetical protein [Calothrix sp. NIES-3974]|uniref:hypothetical protein n=1 Tax=Calothrix sp. NIES-3974 TaxID=2005462 RepID=UPI000B5FD4B2|nr:hypothetical protein [Calothrix sp. NIES-3974]BAZ06782.1 hypothetical protein NIES3974_34440 [Calothrix sp. NIES-3974]
MGLFDQILGAVANPTQQGSMEQIGSILNIVQQMSGNVGSDPSSMQSVMSVVGEQVRNVLQQKCASEGEGAVQSLVNQFAGTTANPQAVSSLFTPEMQQQVAQMAAQRTGLDVSMIQQALPTIVPMILNLLNTGASNQNPEQGGNPVLQSFLDADGDGDVDIADVMRLASQHLGK